MKRFAAAVLAVALVTGGLLFSQDELNLIGRYDDIERIVQPKNDTNQFVFARLIYNGRIPGYYKNWYTDYPKADHQLMMGIKRLTNIDIADAERAIPINDPSLFNYPLIYSSEPEQIVLTTQDAATLREYLNRGGFWIMDDFWGTGEWAAMEEQLRKVLPDAEIKDIPRDHEIFHAFYDIDKLVQVPSLAYVYTGITFEKDGFEAECKGIWDEHGRLMFVIHHNTDLGDAYEWADEPRYANIFGGYAYRMAMNMFLYALTH